MRELLAAARRRVLAGVSIVFSAVYPKTPGAGDRWWALARRVRGTSNQYALLIITLLWTSAAGLSTSFRSKHTFLTKQQAGCSALMRILLI